MIPQKTQTKEKEQSRKEPPKESKDGDDLNYLNQHNDGC